MKKEKPKTKLSAGFLANHIGGGSCTRLWYSRINSVEKRTCKMEF